MERGDSKPTLEHIKRENPLLPSEKSDTGAKALVAVATPVRKGEATFEVRGECSRFVKRGHRSEECHGGKQKKEYKGCFFFASQEYKAVKCPMRWKGENGNESALLTRATDATADLHSTSLRKVEIWTSDSGATRTMTLSSKALINDTIESEGRYFAAGDGNLLPVAGSGQLEISAE